MNISNTNKPKNHLGFIVSFKGHELIVKPEVAQLSSFFRSQGGHIPDEIFVLDQLLVRAESTNSLGISKTVSYEEVVIVFSLVDKIYTTLTPRIDGGYVVEQVQQEVDDMLVNYDNTSLGNICRITDVLGISFLVNACVSTIMSRPDIVEAIVFLENVDEYIPADEDLIARQLFERDFGWFDQERILKLLKKHFLLKKNSFSDLSSDYMKS